MYHAAGMAYIKPLLCGWPMSSLLAMHCVVNSLLLAPAYDREA